MDNDAGDTGLSRDERAELFEVQVRGTVATAFNESGVVPTQQEWDIIRGLAEPTMRDVGEIAGRTGFNVYLQLHDRK